MHGYLNEVINCVDSQLTKLLNQYKPTPQATKLIQQVTTVLLVGIAGAGKDSIKNILLKTGKYHDIVSHTTRSPRKNNGIPEKDGIEYHFISKQTAKDMLEKQLFIEAKWVHRQNVYATSVGEFELCFKNNKIALADIEVQGVEEYMTLSPQKTKPIFLLPPNYDIWLTRFKARYEGHVGQGEFKERLHTATEEIEHVLARPFFSIVINDDLEATAAQVDAIASSDIQSDTTIEYGRRCALRLLHSIKQQDFDTT